MFQSKYTSWIWILLHLCLEINHRNWEVQLVISEITGSVHDFPGPHKTQKQKLPWLFWSLLTCFSNMISSTQTLTQIKSQEFIRHIKQHYMTDMSTMTFKILWNVVLKLDALRPSTFDLSRCYLVHHNLKAKLTTGKLKSSLLSFSFVEFRRKKNKHYWQKPTAPFLSIKV